MRNLKLLIVSLALFAICGNAMADSVVINNMLSGDSYDFEGGTMGSWGTWGNSSTSEVIAPGYNDSKYCLHLSNPSAGSDYYVAQAGFKLSSSLTNGTTYKLRFKAKSASEGGSIQFCYQNSSTYSGAGYNNISLTTDWAVYEYNVTVSKDDMDRLIISFGKVADDFYIDEIEFGTESTEAAPSITTDLQAAYSVQQNKALSLSIVAAGSPEPTYQWYSNAKASTTGATAIDGATEASYKVPTSVVCDLYYYCVVTNSLGTATSTITKVSVTEATSSSSQNGQYVGTDDGLYLMAEDYEANTQGDEGTVENANGGKATVVADPNEASANAMNFVTGSYKNTEYYALPVTLPAGVKLSDFTDIAFDLCYEASKDNTYKTITVALDEMSNTLGTISSNSAPATWATQTFSLTDKTTDNNTFTLYIGGMSASVGSLYIDNIRLKTSGYAQIGTSTTYWKYDSATGHLDIVGTGAIPDYNSSTSLPWNSYRGSGIKTLTIGEGITTIGKNNFYECKAITSISFPSTLEKICDTQAFVNNTALTSIDLSNTKVTYIGTNAFKGCNAVTSVILPPTLESLGASAFYIKNTSCVFEFHSNPTFGATVFYSGKYKEANLVLNDAEMPFVCGTTDNTYNNATYNRTTPNGYFTIMLPFVPTTGLENIKLYELSSIDENVLTFTAVDAANFAANTPYLAKAAEGDKSLTTASVTIKAPTAGSYGVGEWTLEGTYTLDKKDGETDSYYYGFTDTQLVHNTGIMIVRPFRAYMTYTGTNAKESLFFDTPDDTPSVINTLDAELSTMQIYNTNGVRQGELQKGVNIVKFSNGSVKKIIIK